MKVYGQPVISRETRRLLITIVVSVAALWVLARIRFQERPVTSTPVPNVLAQLRPVLELRRSGAPDRRHSARHHRRGVRVGRRRPRASHSRRCGRHVDARARQTRCSRSDRATGLAIVRHRHGDMPGLMPWAPRLLDYPRYLVAADLTGRSRGAATGLHRRAVSCDEPALVRRGMGASALDGDHAGHVRVHDRRRICRSRREPRRAARRSSPPRFFSARSIGCSEQDGRSRRPRHCDPTALARHRIGDRRRDGRGDQRDRSGGRSGRPTGAQPK